MEHKLQAVLPIEPEIGRILHFHIGVAVAIKRSGDVGLNVSPFIKLDKGLLLYAASHRLLHATYSSSGEIVGYVAGYTPGFLINDSFKEIPALAKIFPVSMEKIEWYKKNYHEAFDDGCNPYHMQLQVALKPDSDQKSVLAGLINEVLIQMCKQKIPQIVFFTHRNEFLADLLKKLDFRSSNGRIWTITNAT